MANSTLTLITSIAMIILFTIAILGFSIGFAEDNDADVRIDQDPNISSMDIFTRSSLSTFEEDTEKTYSSIINTTVEAGSDAIKSPRVFTITWDNLFSTFYNILFVMYATIFGGGASFGIFITSLVAIIGILATFYIIKTWRGNP